MRIRLLQSSVTGHAGRQNATTFLVGDTLAVDAGSLGYWGTVEEQARVRHVLVTHSHADHVASLPVFVENVYGAGDECVTVWGNAAVLESLREDVFNGRLWPDLEALSPPDAPFLRFAELDAEVPVELEGLRITPVPVDHTVPNFGFVIDDGDRAVVIVSDTAPTERIWELANSLPHLAAVFLESSFPNRMRELAEVSKHLTSEQFGEEARKLTRPADLVAVHLKPRYREEIVRELAALGLHRLIVGEPGVDYTW